MCLWEKQNPACQSSELRSGFEWCSNGLKEPPCSKALHNTEVWRVYIVPFTFMRAYANTLGLENAPHISPW